MSTCSAPTKGVRTGVNNQRFHNPPTSRELQFARTHNRTPAQTATAAARSPGEKRFPPVETYIRKMPYRRRIDAKPSNIMDVLNMSITPHIPPPAPQGEESGGSVPSSSSVKPSPSVSSVTPSPSPSSFHWAMGRSWPRVEARRARQMGHDSLKVGGVGAWAL